MSKSYYDRLNSGQSCPRTPFTSSIGANLLQKMGWKEGKGLGKEEVGIQECIQINKRSENLGLGAELQRSSSNDWSDWWKDAYNNVASKLSTNIKDSRFEDLDISEYSTEEENEDDSSVRKSRKMSSSSKKKNGEKSSKKTKKSDKEKKRKKSKDKKRKSRSE
ncbi:G patch domain-containing protein [Cryptosporidium canis]|uniref:G patch domain-containing protein n=1 Tax=Cryptosporidium canis TaxID=195482 RepID=A0ABQ8P5Y9_9CRYT|nr:G patch domain-containing protein [Cryptosporidium canis]KAJ1609171.1 G patch domain-containing protein [Cryptosporidium canis]